MQIMVERDGLPFFLPMARFTLLSVSPFMFVVFLMAGIAIHWGIFKGRCQVTLFAFHFGMLPH
jgi:hypothetical protein